MKILILGPGCQRCQALADNAKKAAQELGMDADIEKVKEMGKIMSFGVMSTPAIVIDGQVKGAGKLFTVEEIKKMLQ